MNRLFFLSTLLLAGLSVGYAFGLDEVLDTHATVAPGESVAFLYSDLATNAVSPVGKARVVGLPSGRPGERKGTLSFDHEKLTYTAPADWEGLDEVAFRVADDENSRYGRLLIVVEAREPEDEKAAED